MFFKTLALFSLVTPFVLSQNSTASNDTQLQIEAIEAHFQNAGLVPSLLKTFDPVALLNVSFDNVAITPGQNLTGTQVKSTPTLEAIPANSSIQFSGQYTIAMVDADTVGNNETLQTRHWLVNNVTVNGTTPDFKNATVITAYAGPAPPAGSGPHRYVILMYTQPSSFKAPANLSSTTPVGTFNFPDYVNSTGLQGPVAGMYFQVEEGVATVSLSATAPVVTSTLPVGTASGSGSKATHTGAASSLMYQSSASVGLLGALLSLFL